jgi:outer membrane protein OmpA-like peptidoglycan-associated protein
LFFNIPANSDYAYYSRSVSDNNADIYRVNLPIMKEPEIWVTVKGKLVDAKTGEPISAKVIFEKLPEGQELGVVQPNPETGEFQMKLLAGNLYGVRGEAEGHLSESQNIDLRNVKSEMVLGGKDLQLEPIAIAAIEENAKIVLNNVFFDFDKSVLKPESFPELDRLVKLMGERETMTVEIAGHTDAVGTEEYNMGLSRRRSNAVQQYLTGKGVKSARIKVSYFGESQPAATNDTDEGREKNRRVEFKIIKT